MGVHRSPPAPHSWLYWEMPFAGGGDGLGFAGGRGVSGGDGAGSRGTDGSSEVPGLAHLQGVKASRCPGVGQLFGSAIKLVVRRQSFQCSTQQQHLQQLQPSRPASSSTYAPSPPTHAHPPTARLYVNDSALGTPLQGSKNTLAVAPTTQLALPRHLLATALRWRSFRSET